MFNSLTMMLHPVEAPLLSSSFTILMSPAWAAIRIGLTLSCTPSQKYIWDCVVQLSNLPVLHCCFAADCVFAPSVNWLNLLQGDGPCDTYFWLRVVPGGISFWWRAHPDMKACGNALKWGWQVFWWVCSVQQSSPRRAMCWRCSDNMM